MTKRRRFGKVRRLPSGRWQARFPSPDGIERSLGTFSTKGDADRALSACETDMARGGWTDPTAGKQSFAAYAAGWLEARPLRPRSRELYTNQLRLRLLPIFGRMPVGSITPQHVRYWHGREVAALPMDGRGAAALTTSYRVLRSILSTAVEDELLLRNPCTIRGAGSDRPVLRPTLTEPDVWALADAVPDRYRSLVWLAAGTALRSAELSALRRQDVDLVRGVVQVERAYIEPARGQSFFGPPKSDAGTRVVALPDVLRPILVDHLDRYVGAGQESLLFTTTGGGPVSRHNRKWWRAACSEAGLAPGVHLHDLRHAGLTLAAQSGATLRELMSLAGHSSPRAAMIYQHAAAERGAVIAAGVSDRLTKGR